MKDEKGKLADEYWANDPNLSEVNLNDYSLPQVKDLLQVGKKTFEKFNPKNSNILDIGGGSGKTSRYYGLQNNNNNLYIIDISPNMVEIANKMGCNAFLLDIEKNKFPFNDRFFDIIIFQEVAEHINSLDNVLAECNRILKPGGLLYLTTPNLVSLADRLFLFLGLRPFCMAVDEQHIKFYRSKDIIRILNRFEFSIIINTTQGVYLPLFFRWKFVKIPILHKILPSLGQHVIIMVEKI